MKLHLRCGMRYLEGYVNIDFPPEEHTVQHNLKADRFVNILDLEFEANSIEEIRLHHVFEHFPRPVACALLCNWNQWLKESGVLRIEVPDFKKSAIVSLFPFTKKKDRFVSHRHIFGSHEAAWAVHYEGYTEKLLIEILQHFGFSIIKKLKNNHGATHNIDITAVKKKSILKSEAKDTSLAWLKNFMVDNSPSEVKLLQVWMGAFSSVFKNVSSPSGKP